MNLKIGIIRNPHKNHGIGELRFSNVHNMRD